MLGEDDQLLALPIRCEHTGVVLQQRGELIPFAVFAADSHVIGELLQPAQGRQLRLQFPNGTGSRGLIRDVFFFLLDLFGRIIVFIVVCIVMDAGLVFLSLLADPLLIQPMLQSLTPSAERLIDRLR